MDFDFIFFIPEINGQKYHILPKTKHYRTGPNEIVMVSNQAILAPAAVNQTTAAQQQTRKPQNDHIYFSAFELRQFVFV